MKYFADYHSHSEASPDGEATLAGYLETAKKIGLQEFAVTDHVDLNTNHSPGNFYLDPELQEKNFLFRKNCNEKGIEIKLGVEIGHAGQKPALAESFIGLREYDVVLSSLHNCKDRPDCSYLDYAKFDVVPMVEAYLNELFENLSFANFDIASHLTYPHRYAAMRKSHPPFRSEDYRGLFEKILKKIIQMDKVLEFNTSCIRRGLSFTMPDYSVAKQYYELGGRLISIGSDAHANHELGSGIQEAAAVLREIGFQEIATFTKRKRILKPL